MTAPAPRRNWEVQQAERRCPVHDVLLDPETGCDYCARCPKCGGDGFVTRRHPAYGRLSCPEEYIEEECTCGGAL